MNIDTKAKFQIVSQAYANNVELCAAGDDQGNMIVKTRNRNDLRQNWVFLGIPTVSNPYGGFAFILVNLGYQVLKVAYAPLDNEFPRLIDLSDIDIKDPNVLWRLQSQKAINCIKDNGSPLTIQGGDGWKENSRLQLWGWHDQINQHWTIQ